MSDELKFHNLLDDLRPASLSALIDVADGYWMAAFEWPMIFEALERRGLVKMNFLIDLQSDETKDPVELTDVGAAFVTWYRSRDKDLPVQERLL